MSRNKFNRKYCKAVYAAMRYSLGKSYRQTANILAVPKSTVFDNTCTLTVWYNLSYETRIAAHNVARYYLENQ